MKVLLATHHEQIDALVGKLETEKGIKELADDLKSEEMLDWAKPLTIIDSALYRERLMDKAKQSRPDVILLYDKLPGTIELEILLEEVRLEVKNARGQDTRIVFLTSLEQGSPLLRRAVEIGVWDIISGRDILPIEIIKRLYCPANYSDVAHLRLSSDEKTPVKFIPKYIDNEKKATLPETQKTAVTKIVEKTEYVRVGAVQGSKETVLLWSPFEHGKTFVAVNLAVALAKMGLRISLIDAGIPNRNLENFFNPSIEERHSFLNILKERSGTAEILESCFKYKKNLRVFSLPSNLAEIPEITREEFFDFYDKMRRETDIFIIDGGKDLHSPLTSYALTLSTRVFILVTPDISRVKQTKIILNQLQVAGINLDKFEPILNIAVKTHTPSRQDIAKILEMPFRTVDIPSVVESVYPSIAEGIPALDGSKISESFKFAMSNLANYVNGAEVKGGLKKLLGIKIGGLR